MTGYFNWPFAKRLPLNNYTLGLYSSLSFYTCSNRDSFSTRILFWTAFNTSESFRLKSLKVSHWSSVR
jgi:hypothetical protein